MEGRKGKRNDERAVFFHFYRFLGREGTGGPVIHSFFFLLPLFSQKMTQLWNALTGGDIEAVRRALDAGDDVNRSYCTLGAKPLYWASGKGDKDLCELLIDRGADVNDKNEYGDTPLHEASYWGYKDVCALLIERGADVNAKNNSGETPVHCATYHDVCIIWSVRKASRTGCGRRTRAKVAADSVFQHGTSTRFIRSVVAELKKRNRDSKCDSSEPRHNKKFPKGDA